jgi:hypothetical protein
MRRFRIDRETVAHAAVARALVFASAIPLTIASQGLLVASAGAAEETVKQTSPPSVSTGKASVHGSGVQLEGTVGPGNEATTYYFQYGATNSYGSQTSAASLPAGKAKVKVNQIVTGLLSGYHYRLVANNGKGLADGHDRVYTVKKTTPKKRLALKFTLAKPASEGQVVGSPVTIEGTLSGPGAAGHGVVLQSSSYPSGAIFTNVGTQQTASSSGRFAFFVAHLRQSTRFRVAAVGPAPTYSSAIVELATVRVTLHVRTAPKAGLVRLYGTVSPAVTGAIVYFQLQKAATTRPVKVKSPKSGKAEERAEERAEEKAETPRFATEFSTPVKRATKTVSRFSIVTGIHKGGLYRAFVQVPRGPLASGHSESLLVRATATKKKRKNKG